MAVWWERNRKTLPTMSESNRAWVEEITGRIPLFLKPLCQFPNQDWDEAKFLRCRELQTVKNNIESFYRLLKHTAPEDL